MKIDDEVLFVVGAAKPFRTTLSIPYAKRSQLAS